MLTQDEANRRVALGAAHLDRVRPGWFRHVDVGTLTLHDPCCCMVGQLTRMLGFDIGLRKLDIDGSSSVAFGFDIQTDDYGLFVNREPAFLLLQNAWIAGIAKRLVVDVDPVAYAALIRDQARA